MKCRKDKNILKIHSSSNQFLYKSNYYNYLYINKCHIQNQLKPVVHYMNILNKEIEIIKQEIFLHFYYRIKF